MNEKLHSRLVNWKFSSAVHCLNGESDDIIDMVRLLARLFGNCGWFEGDMATLIVVALQSIGVKDA